MVESNIRRRVWTPEQLAAAYRAIKQALPEDGGTLQPRGRPKKESASGLFSRPSLRSDEEAARRLQIGKHKVRALEAVFYTPGVAQELKDAVNAGKVTPTAALRLIKGTKSSAEAAPAAARGGGVADPAPDRLGFDTATLDRKLRCATKLLVNLERRDAAEVQRALQQVVLDVSVAVSEMAAQAGQLELAPRFLRTEGGWLLPFVQGSVAEVSSARCSNDG